MISNTMDLSFAQLDALLELWEEEEPKIDKGDTVTLEQTYTKSGGTHLYVAIASDPTRCIHISKRGRAVICEGALPKGKAK